jgi:multidrug efflux pump subunit AcrA (membrane-fusion protein)
VSQLDYQTAEAAFLAEQARVEAARAEVEQALNEQESKRAKIGQIANDLQAKIESTKSFREEARSKVALAEKELTEAQTAVERQKTRVVVAPRAGRVFRIRAASQADLLKQGDPLVDLVPYTDDLAVELWVRGNDAPLIEPGRKVRLQFEGWPAVQFSGWPSVAVGTFGGEVLLVDAQDDGSGRFRILVGQDRDDPDWPDRRYLRQGVRTNGWVLLDEVMLGYEIWRQLNGFPPSVRQAPEGKS